MTKKTLTISIDVNTYEQAKAKMCPFSQIMEEALINWLNQNKTLEEKQIEIKEIQNEAIDMRLSAIADQITKATLDNENYRKWTRGSLSKKGFTEEEINLIFELAEEKAKGVIL